MLTSKKLWAAGTHLYTMSGVLFSLWATIALIEKDIGAFLLALFLAVVVDATDGTMARRLGIKEIYPNFDGAKLDDLIDYLTFVFLPCMGLIQFGILEPGWNWVAAVPMLASLYGFCQDNAKTEESFVGFPSYWNLVFLYLYVLEFPNTMAIGVLLFFSLLIFVPLHYIYPTKTRFMKRTTTLLSIGYGLLVAYVCLFPNTPSADTAAGMSLVFPAYYMSLSIIHHFRVTRGEREGA
ncbi:CDP-alcohol phosphatidyltransferase family protein [Desulfohalobium retbaense]|uniref:Phosphatidylcholine synthase n=1 Tax=Desulfohalobium retbaense (strain ATCC 49708 / DSM 5692 / JCM 16813 / HR100) TaxID=485915 RepID=C8X2B0_DESRD|nr:CDP-alcohol phosphatidyltransferase family protein [Desulfohalobium retbaense]ACV68433.1 phosphatidylcholine synthase [Desulfohalobium retbaense DSM 5692]